MTEEYRYVIKTEFQEIVGYITPLGATTKCLKHAAHFSNAEKARCLMCTLHFNVDKKYSIILIKQVQTWVEA